VLTSGDVGLGRSILYRKLRFKKQYLPFILKEMQASFNFWLTVCCDSGTKKASQTAKDKSGAGAALKIFR
jgi:hypothetical protein